MNQGIQRRIRSRSYVAQNILPVFAGIDVTVLVFTVTLDVCLRQQFRTALHLSIVHDSMLINLIPCQMQPADNTSGTRCKCPDLQQFETTTNLTIIKQEEHVDKDQVELRSLVHG